MFCGYIRGALSACVESRGCDGRGGAEWQFVCKYTSRCPVPNVMAIVRALALVLK